MGALTTAKTIVLAVLRVANLDKALKEDVLKLL